MQSTGNKEYNFKESTGWSDEDEETKIINRRMEMTKKRDELTKRGMEKDFLKRLMIERNEVEQEEILIRAQEARELRRRQVEEAQKLDEDALRRQNEDILEHKRREMLRNDSIELRQFDNQIRAYYVAKDVKAQVMEREICRKNRKMKEIEDARLMQGHQNDEEIQQKLKDQRKKEEYRRDLQDQLVLNDHLRQQKTEEMRRERKLAEELSEVLRTEDFENQRRKRETAAQLLAEERAFLESRKLFKCKEKQVLQKEEEDHARFLADKIMERKRIDEVKAAASAAREAMMEKMRKKMLDDEFRKKEYENVLNELIEEEQKNDLENQSQNIAMEKNHRAKELLDEMMRQRMAIDERKAKDAEADRAFAEYLKKDCEKSIIFDKLKAEERRAKGVEYGEALKKAIADQSIRYENEILENQAEFKRNQELLDLRQKSINEERLRMVQKHAPYLQEYLKPSMVESGNIDIPAFSNGALKL